MIKGLIKPYFYFTLMLLGGTLLPTIALANLPDVNISAEPKWVIKRQANLIQPAPVDDIAGGIYYRLLDTQINVEKNGTRATYYRYVESVINKAGVDANSQINFSYDPSYQNLTLHSLFLIRAGKKIDKLSSAKISVFHSENDLKTQMYYGELTINILIDDLREGDTLDYSFSRHGANPIYNGIFSYRRNLNWSVPVQNQFIRVRWGKSQPLYINARNFTADIQKTERDNYKVYDVALENEPTIQMPSETPKWFDPYGQIFFSETKTWLPIVEWALPLYQFEDIHPNVQAIADSIKSQSTQPEKQIPLALKFVQDEIRYVGLEMGVNSHKPTPAHETLTLRYGDCKDKTVLLIELLKALNINAYPALVNTDDTKLLAEYPAAINAFNHVIVTFVYQGERYWLDPTMRNQHGELNALYQPNFHYALVIKEEEKDLTPMFQQNLSASVVIQESYYLPEKTDETAKLSVLSSYLGGDAVSKESLLESEGIKGLTEQYEEYYQRTYSGLTVLSDLAVSRDTSKGQIAFKEEYQITDIWSEEEDGYEIDFYPTEVRNAIYKPKKSKRSTPIALTFPNNITNVLEVSFQETGWGFEDKTFIEENEFFTYQSSVVFVDNILTVTFNYIAHKDHVPALKIPLYLEARDRVLEDAYYGIIKYYPEETASDQLKSWLKTANQQAQARKEKVISKPQAADNFAHQEQDNQDGNKKSHNKRYQKLSIEEEQAWRESEYHQRLFLFFIALFILLLIAFITLMYWRHSLHQSEREPINYAYTSICKFLILSVLTFGCYPSYWVYQQWKVLKTREALVITPFYRALLSPFTFYALYRAFNHTCQSSTEQAVMRQPIAVLFSLLHLLPLIFIALQLFDIAFIAWLLVGILYIPLVEFTQTLSSCVKGSINTYRQPRYLGLVFIFIAISGCYFAKQAFVIPSQQVVQGSELSGKQIKFLKQQGLLTPSGSLIQFYSDDWLSIAKDGAGFSQQQVFSYWFDQQSQLKKHVVEYKNITKIDVDYALDDEAYTAITIYPKEQTSFSIYVLSHNEQDQAFVKALRKRWQNIYFTQTKSINSNTG